MSLTIALEKHRIIPTIVGSRGVERRHDVGAGLCTGPFFVYWRVEDSMDKRIYRTGYVSELDQFLRDFDKSHPQFCAERQREIAKFKRIFKLRDPLPQQQKD